MKPSNKLIITILSSIIAILIGIIAVISWCYIPIEFEDSPTNMHITRTEEVNFYFYDPLKNKYGVNLYGYDLMNDEVNFLDRVMLYDMLSDMKPTDVIPQMDDNAVNAMADLSIYVGNAASNIVIVCDRTRSYIRVNLHMKRDGFINSRSTNPIFYSVNPDKVTNLISHLISRAEKLHPERYGSESSQ